jgi:DNA replication protein DnaC
MASIGPRHTLLKALAQGRVNHTFEKMFRRFLAPAFLIVDDFELRRLTAQQSRDLYDLIIERHRRSSFVFTILWNQKSRVSTRAFPHSLWIVRL